MVMMGDITAIKSIVRSVMRLGSNVVTMCILTLTVMHIPGTGYRSCFDCCEKTEQSICYSDSNSAPFHTTVIGVSAVVMLLNVLYVFVDISNILFTAIRGEPLKCDSMEYDSTCLAYTPQIVLAMSVYFMSSNDDNYCTDFDEYSCGFSIGNSTCIQVYNGRETNCQRDAAFKKMMLVLATLLLFAPCGHLVVILSRTVVSFIKRRVHVIDENVQESNSGTNNNNMRDVEKLDDCADSHNGVSIPDDNIKNVSSNLEDNEVRSFDASSNMRLQEVADEL